VRASERASERERERERETEIEEERGGGKREEEPRSGEGRRDNGCT